MTVELIGEQKIFEGRQLRFRHVAESVSCDMVFSLFLPPQAEAQAVPVLYWLSGLTCTDENFVTKAGAQRYAAEHGIAIVAPDTSPRGEGVPDDADGAWDFGLGAGFYVNATEAPWSRHYHMYDYVAEELPAALASITALDLSRESISGHSMGGHGALTLALNQPARYRSISAFAPISSPTRCPWGEKALESYLGNNKASWERHDAALLLSAVETTPPILVDQGGADNFLEEQLKPELLQEAVAGRNLPVELRLQPGYDHSYFFISTFIGEHVAFHAKHLQA